MEIQQLQALRSWVDRGINVAHIGHRVLAVRGDCTPEDELSARLQVCLDYLFLCLNTGLFVGACCS
jgi:hypothetical protein